MEPLIPFALLALAFVAFVIVLATFRRSTRARQPERDSGDKLVVLTTVAGDANAAILIGSLRAAGIQAVSRNSSRFPMYVSLGWGEHQVIVRGRDFDEAREVIGLHPLDALDV